MPAIFAGSFAAAGYRRATGSIVRSVHCYGRYFSSKSNFASTMNRRLSTRSRTLSVSVCFAHLTSAESRSFRSRQEACPFGFVLKDSRRRTEALCTGPNCEGTSPRGAPSPLWCRVIGCTGSSPHPPPPSPASSARNPGPRSATLAGSPGRRRAGLRGASRRSCGGGARRCSGCGC